MLPILTPFDWYWSSFYNIYYNNCPSCQNIVNQCPRSHLAQRSQPTQSHLQFFVTQSAYNTRHWVCWALRLEQTRWYLSISNRLGVPIPIRVTQLSVQTDRALLLHLTFNNFGEASSRCSDKHTNRASHSRGNLTGERSILRDPHSACEFELSNVQWISTVGETSTNEDNPFS